LMPTAKTRRLTVCNKGFTRELRNCVYFPSILLCGKWLRDAGFKSGHTIDIICEDDKIIIKKSVLQRFDIK
ncbi:SymE family type I addiction module toxin, partial [Acinetobacter baumannii]